MIFHNSIWECMPQLSDWLRQQRENIVVGEGVAINYLLQGVNYSLILNSAVMLEGYIDDIFRYNKRAYLPKNADIKKELEKVSKMTWSKYRSSFPWCSGSRGHIVRARTLNREGLATRVSCT